MHQIQLLKKYGLSVRGAKGQHLLVDENIQRKIADCVSPKPNDQILEIGPGLGAITQLLLKGGAHVVAVEQDERFVQILKGELEQDYKKTLELVHKDILKTDLAKYAKGPHSLRVVGNIPYYITSDILLHLIAHRKSIDSVYLMVQREIADRFFAQPGTKAYGRLSLLVRFYSDPTREFEISRGCFAPPPAVDSTFLSLSFRRTLPEGINEAVLFDLIKFGFGNRRKNILNALTDGFKGRINKQQIGERLAAVGITQTTRAEQLMLKDFIRLAERFSS